MKTDTAAVDSNPLPRRRLFLAVLVGIIIVGIIGSASLLVFSRGSRALSAAIAETDRLDPGWRWADLQADRAQVPDPENNARIIEKSPGCCQNRGRNGYRYQALECARAAAATLANHHAE